MPNTKVNPLLSIIFLFNLGLNICQVVTANKNTINFHICKLETRRDRGRVEGYFTLVLIMVLEVVVSGVIFAIIEEVIFSLVLIVGIFHKSCLGVSRG